MENLKTTVFWVLSDYCKAQCDYCPPHISGGLQPYETNEYLRVANAIIDSYSFKRNRKLEWSFTGGEPLDIEGLVPLLKLCKSVDSYVILHTNGGTLWMDWWAIEPYVDQVVLTFHYWQNTALMKYIIDVFKEKGKPFSITAPIRPNYTREDARRAAELESMTGLLIEKTQLYVRADPAVGMLNYSELELRTIEWYNLPKDKRIVRPVEEWGPGGVLVKEKKLFQETSWEDRYNDTYSKHPSFTGKLCNAGIEYLFIGSTGWASGSACNNASLGNVWNAGWAPPETPQTCTMISCIHESDQKITKFI